MLFYFHPLKGVFEKKKCHFSEQRLKDLEGRSRYMFSVLVSELTTMGTVARVLGKSFLQYNIHLELINDLKKVETFLPGGTADPSGMTLENCKKFIHGEHSSEVTWPLLIEFSATRKEGSNIKPAKK